MIISVVFHLCLPPAPSANRPPTTPHTDRAAPKRRRRQASQQSSSNFLLHHFPPFYFLLSLSVPPHSTAYFGLQPPRVFLPSAASNALFSALDLPKQLLAASAPSQPTHGDSLPSRRSPLPAESPFRLTSTGSAPDSPRCSFDSYATLLRDVAHVLRRSEFGAVDVLSLLCVETRRALSCARLRGALMRVTAWRARARGRVAHLCACSPGAPVRATVCCACEW